MEQWNLFEQINSCTKPFEDCCFKRLCNHKKGKDRNLMSRYSFCLVSFGSWQQHPTRHQLYGHLPPITKTIQVRRIRHAGHCWRSRDELIRDVLLWIPTHGRAKAGRPARTYIQQLCEDTGCCPEDLPRAMNDREEWRERVRDIRATSAIWWWWWTIEQVKFLFGFVWVLAATPHKTPTVRPPAPYHENYSS